ncbi:MAG TPA: L-threonylcarbamoyladenylate synthase [Ilumatobacteraceae bacterium]
MTPEIGAAVSALRRGGLVAFPTETVYGLGADATNASAVRRVFQVKGRPESHPLIVHLAAADELSDWVRHVPEPARLLAAACWPGPMTLLLERAASVLPEITGGLATVGIRVPAHPMAQELLRAFGNGIAAPSANRFGHVSPTTAEHVRGDLGGDVDVILDGGPSAVGIESTIVDCTTDPPQVLRPGAITAADISTILDGGPAAASGPSRAPGMLESHYAPRCRVVLGESRDVAVALAADAAAQGLRTELLDPAAPIAEYARNLYAWLREADARGVDVLVAVLPPATGIGVAVRDRLIKAAAPRPDG